MCSSNSLAYAGLAVVAAASLWLAFAISRYPLRALRLYRTAVVASLAVGLLRVIGNYVAQELLWSHSAPPAAHEIVYWVFRLLAVPFSVLALYAFVAMSLALANKRFPAAWQAVFLVAQVLSEGLPLLREYAALSSGQPDPTGWLLRRVFEGANTALLLVLLLVVLHRWRGERDHPLYVAVTTFAAAYLVLFASGYLAVYWLTTDRVYRIVLPIVVFFTHLGPLLFLYAFLRRRHPGDSQALLGSDALTRAMAHYGISSREADVVRLLAQGSSYREIEAKLCISMPTVKTHVSSIYRKVGIHRRWELLQALATATDSPEPDPPGESGPCTS